MNIPFNKPYLIGNEINFIKDAVEGGHISGNGKYTKLCQQYFEDRYGFKKCLLTSSCTDALEMAAILCEIKLGDEVIVPSFTFVSTANAFMLRGANVVFADSNPDHPNLDDEKLEEYITPKTKAIVIVHYAGNACNMSSIMALAEKYSLYVIEDAAQAIDSYYLKDGKQTPLGDFGHFSTFSFHETKNIICGEGGMLVINDKEHRERAEIIWEKGTNRSAFFRGEIDKYGWVDIGSSFLPSDMNAAFLWAQLSSIDKIQQKRRSIWNRYYNLLKDELKHDIQLPHIPEYATNNAHMFYLRCTDQEQRDALIAHLKSKGIMAVFHYQSLHRSKFYLKHQKSQTLPNADYFSEALLRLPFFYGIDDGEIDYIVENVLKF